MTKSLKAFFSMSGKEQEGGHPRKTANFGPARRLDCKPFRRQGIGRIAQCPVILVAALLFAKSRYPPFRAMLDHSSRRSIQVGAWSLVPSRPRTLVSTPAAVSRFAAGGLSRRGSMRMPALRAKAFRQ